MNETKIDLSKYHGMERSVDSFARPLPQRTVCFNESFLNPKDVEKPDWIYID